MADHFDGKRDAERLGGKTFSFGAFVVSAANALPQQTGASKIN